MSTIHYTDDTITLHHGDAAAVLATLPDRSADCVVTSPPYFGLRDYGVAEQIGAERSPGEFVERLRLVFDQVRRVLADDGTCWINLGDSYNAYNGNRGPSATGFSRNDPLPARPTGYGLSAPELAAKNLIGIPWRVAFALQDDGWILRNAIIWHKPNAMPESVTDRLGTRYETLFMLTRSQRYWFDLDPIREQSRNPGDVWRINTQPFPGAHFAVYPPELVRRCVVAGCKPGGVVLDPFHGSGTTGAVATSLGHRYTGIDLSAEYLDMSLTTRLANGTL
jgi:site-specific DNA-methyltransferase (cytosine-N4-specific)